VGLFDSFRLNAAAAAIVLSSVVAQASGAEASGNPGVAWPATDALGRALPLATEVGPPKQDRFVGIFYFLWLNERHNKGTIGEGPFDISKILAKDPDVLKKPDSPLWGPPGRAHYWGEPLYGYYLTDDAWVLRRHAQLLAEAGVDTLIFDTTNRATYKRNYLKLCEVFADIRKAGGRTPQFAFMVNTEAGETADELFRDLYEPGLHPELWFRWKGKPLLICDPEEASPKVREFFTLRRAHWPFTMENTKDAWHWEATYPQPYGYSDDPKTPEQVNVSVAQNLGFGPKHTVENMSSGKARGRGFHAGKQDASADAIDGGANFAEQWERAIKLDPPFVMVTGWNEWIAGRFSRPGEPVAFVDQFDREFSRDIEPMKGGHGDNFYYQFVAGVRRYKGVPALPVASAEKTIDITKGFEQWSDVGPAFADHVGDTAPRDHDGAAGLRYTDRSGRHDFVAMKVARDADNVYFYARTTDSLGSDSLPAGMRLMINADQNVGTGWAGFDFAVESGVGDDRTAWLVKYGAAANGAGNWTRVTKVATYASGNQLHLAIPRSALGMKPGAATFDFKWVDHLNRTNDVMDFYVSGDVAPDARFCYRFIGQ
jgi:hypothetical protein